MAADGETRRWVVRGHVQGVGFRMYVQREASQLRLRGTVRNTVDGAVEVVASGDAATLDGLEAMLRQGPPASTVSSVESTPYDLEASSLPAVFTIVS